MPSSASRLLIGFIVAPSNLMEVEKFISFSATYGVMRQIVFRGVVSSAGSDRYGERRYAIYIPKSVRGKVREIAGKEVIVIVILPDDDEE